MYINSKLVMRNIEYAIGIFITILIIYFHFIYMFHAGGLWRDEVCQVQHATMQSMSDVWTATEVRPIPLLSIMILRIWVNMGFRTTDLDLRIYGLFVGILIVISLWLNARLTARSVPLFSLALFGLSPLTICIGDSIRPYGLGIFFILLTFGLIWMVTYSPSILRIIFATTTAILSVQCFFQNAYLLLAICLGGIAVTLVNKMWRRSLLLVGIGLVAALSLLPYLEVIKKAQDWAPLAQNPSSLRTFLGTLLQAFGFSRIPNLFSFPNIVFIFWIEFVFIGIAISFYTSFFKSKEKISNHRRDSALYSIISMATGMIELIIFMRRTGIITQPWHFLPGVALVAVSLDTILSPKHLTSMNRIILTILIVGLSFHSTMNKVQIRQTNIDLISSHLEKSCSKGDMIVVHPWFCGITFQRYYRGNVLWVTIPSIEDLTLTRYDLLKKQMASINPIQQVLTEITKTLKSGSRVWLVGGLPYLPKNQSPPYLPPAPNRLSGWRSAPYLDSWSKQVEYFIQSHVSDREYLQISTDVQINRLENLRVEIVRGWLKE